MALRERLLEVMEDSEKLAALGGEIALKLTLAIAIFYFGKWAAEAVVKLIRFGMKRGQVDETLRDFLANVLYGVLLALVVVTALTQLGVETTSAAAVLGGAALAIGLSLQSQLSSLAAGVILIVFRPFNKGDFVEIGGTRGFVEEIKIVHTRLRATDNREVTVPNSSITTQTITNFTARHTRRVDVLISLAPGTDVLRAKQVLMGVLTAHENVLKTPAVSVEISALTGTSIEFTLQAWVRTEHHWTLKAELLEALHAKLGAEAMKLAAPAVELRANA